MQAHRTDLPALIEKTITTFHACILGLQRLPMPVACVIAQTSSPDKAALMKTMGAHEVIVHGRGEDFSKQVKDLTDGRGVDVVVDNVGTSVIEPTRRSLSILGRWLMIGQLDGKFVPFNPAQLFLKGQSLISATSTTRAQIEEVLQLIARKQITPVIDRSFSLDEARVAHSLMEEGRITGRTLIRPSLS